MVGETITAQVDPKLATALAVFGPWGALAGLALTFGLPFVDKLVENAHNNAPVTPEAWAAQRATIAKTFEEL